MNTVSEAAVRMSVALSRYDVAASDVEASDVEVEAAWAAARLAESAYFRLRFAAEPHAWMRA